MHYGGGGRYESWIKKRIHRNDVDGLRGGNLRLQSVSRGGTCRAAAGGTGADGFRRTGWSDCGLRKPVSYTHLDVYKRQIHDFATNVAESHIVTVF